MKITQTGMYVPNRIENNNYFVDKLGLNTNAQWILNKTGISTRHFAYPNQNTSDLATAACLPIIDDPKSIDLIILATTTPDMAIPSASGQIQRKLGCTCPTVDINNACSGFIYALDIAYHYIKCGTYRKILVIGADVSSKLVNFSDRLTSIFFGDGAGAVIVEQNEHNSVYSRHLATEGNFESISTNNNGKLTMNGQEIWNFALRVFPETINILLEKANISIDKLDWIIPHQANSEMIKACIKIINYPEDKVIINVDKYGNTISATIPMALHEAINDGRIKAGDIVAMVGFGAGLSWGGILMEI